MKSLMISLLTVLLVVSLLVGADVYFSSQNATPKADEWRGITAAVAELFKDPETTTFTKGFVRKTERRKLGGEVWEASGWVRASNSFGAFRKSRFECEALRLESLTGGEGHWWSVCSLTVDGRRIR